MRSWGSTFVRISCDLGRLSPITHLMLAAGILISLCFAFRYRLSISAPAELYVAPVAELAGGIALRRHIRPSVLLTTLGVLNLFALAGGFLSYAVQALAYPLRDDLFLAMDRSLGFEWLAFQRFMFTQDPLVPFLGMIYDTFPAQVVGVPVALIVAGRIGSLDRFVLAFMLSVAVSIGVSALLPSMGAASLTGFENARLLPGGATPLGHMFALRDGTMPVIDVTAIGGMISFPSMHCALAVLATAGIWPIRWLRIPMLVLNGFLILSAVVIGAHYLSDCIAGCLVAAVALPAAGRLGPWSRRVAGRLRVLARAAVPAPGTVRPA